MSLFSIEFSKQVKQKVQGTNLVIQNLEEEVTYTFTVRAQTIDYGPPISGNVTTGPQEGSPVAPRDLLLAKTVASVDMHWVNSPSGKGPILGYYIETKKRGNYFYCNFFLRPCSYFTFMPKSNSLAMGVLLINFFGRKTSCPYF